MKPTAKGTPARVNWKAVSTIFDRRKVLNLPLRQRETNEKGCRMKETMRGLGWKGDRDSWSFLGPDGSISLLNEGGTIRLCLWHNAQGSSWNLAWEDQREIRCTIETGGNYLEALRQSPPTLSFKMAGTELLGKLVATADALEASKKRKG